jgi:glycosyltransferase involved in cell wall biosynthesis
MCWLHRALTNPDNPVRRLVLPVALASLALARFCRLGWVRRFGRRVVMAGFEALTALLVTSMRLGAFFGAKNDRTKVRSVVHVGYISTKQYMLSRVMREQGLRANYLAINTTPNDRLNLGCDYSIPMGMGRLRRLMREVWLFWRVLAWHDVVHYHFNAFLVGDGVELPYLKRMGKLVVFHFRGCDVRDRTTNMTKNPALNLCQECDYPVGSCDTDYQRQRLAKVRRYGDMFFVTTPDMRDFWPDAEHIPFIAPYGVDFDAIVPAPRTDGVLRVVTSSNHPGLDGVPHIREAVSRLQSEGYAIELVEIVKKPYFEALAIYKSADVFVGKLRMGYYNNANIETMLMGVPNMSYIRSEFMDSINDCPIIVTKPDDVYEKLAEWAAKPDELRALGRRGPDFVRAHHDPHAIVAMMVERYNHAAVAKTVRMAHGEECR